MTDRYSGLRTRNTLRDNAGDNAGWMIGGAVVMLFLLGTIAFTWNPTPTNMASYTAAQGQTGAMTP